MNQSREPKPCDSLTSYAFPTDNKLGEFYWRWFKLVIGFFLLASSLLVFYTTLSSQFHLKCLKCSEPVTNPDVRIGTETVSVEPTNISHIVFGIGGSAATWKNRSRYSELWWRPGQTRGFVWLDKRPSGNDTWPEKSPPYRISADSSRFRGSRSAVRIARIVAESVRLGMEGVRWYVMGDDDTVFVTENLVSVLGRYDHEEFYYVGGVSESVEQDVMHSYGMAFGGGGFAISYGLARELARVLDDCLVRYASFYGSDQRVHACLTEFGVPLTAEAGFHQVDLRGNIYGLLAAHPLAPLVSLHHLDSVVPIIPGRTQHDALQSILGAARSDPSRILQQTFCYDRQRNWSVSVSWGYTAQIYTRILTPKDLSTPLRTFSTWRSYHEGPFTFNTRAWPKDPCDRPLVYLVDRVHDLGKGGTRSSYLREKNETQLSKECARSKQVAALKIETVAVFAPKMRRDEWRKALRRHCCDVHHEARHKNGIKVTIRKCHPSESLSPP
ncbi:fringe-related family protein [Cinnamomum micranthum f. kanehirae]|uniref:Fringe-related family protein n=1 Tax=Cinnamomum micranthum f. kanehirae TaxID=337451 RepID=A0A443NDV9_9MAGN|nr:fringe-related family protein [Cinnamomum micranthum f. kanehirae]